MTNVIAAVRMAGLGLLMVLVMSRPAVAQRPVDTRKPFPPSAELPKLPTDVVEAYALAYALATPMVELDPALPALDLETWLNVTIWEKAAAPRPAVWMLTWCEDLTSDHPGWGPELCAEATAYLKDSWPLQLYVKIGEWRTSAGGEGAWVPVPRVFRGIVLEDAHHGSADIRSPSDLIKALDTPVERWPKVDLKVSIEAAPRHPRPGDLVTVRFRVHNAGLRDVARVQMRYSLWAPSDGENLQEFEWFPRIPAGHIALVELNAQATYGLVIADVEAHVFSPRIKESDSSDNDVNLWVGSLVTP